MPNDLTTNASNTVATVDPADPAASLSVAPVSAPGSNLTPRQRQFASELLKGLSKTDAYVRAFPNTRKRRTACAEGGKLSRDPRIQKFMEELGSRVTNLSAVSVSDVERGLAQVAFSDVRKLFGPDGKVLPPGEWPEDAAMAVSSYQEEVSPNGTRLTRKIKLWDKPAALKMLADVKAMTGKKPDAGRTAHFTFDLSGLRPGRAPAKAEKRVKGRVLDQGEDRDGGAGATQAIVVVSPHIAGPARSRHAKVADPVDGGVEIEDRAMQDEDSEA